MFNYVYSLVYYEIGYQMDFSVKHLIIKEETDENVSKVLKQEVLKFLEGKCYRPEEVEEYFQNCIDNGKYKKHLERHILQDIQFMYDETDYEDKYLRIEIEKLETH